MYGQGWFIWTTLNRYCCGPKEQWLWITHPKPIHGFRWAPSNQHFFPLSCDSFLRHQAKSTISIRWKISNWKTMKFQTSVSAFELHCFSDITHVPNNCRWTPKNPIISLTASVTNLPPKILSISYHIFRKWPHLSTFSAITFIFSYLAQYAYYYSVKMQLTQMSYMPQKRVFYDLCCCFCNLWWDHACQSFFWRDTDFTVHINLWRLHRTMTQILKALFLRHTTIIVFMIVTTQSFAIHS